MKSYIRNAQPNESGTTLIVALLFLLIATVLGTTAMSSSKMQINMSRNVQQKSVAFERSENAREAAELRVRELVASGDDFPGGTSGHYDVSSGGAVPATTSKAFWSIATNYVAVGTGGGYVIEYLGEKDIELDDRSRTETMQVYRLTVLGRGADGASETVSQAVYIQN